MQNGAGIKTNNIKSSSRQQYSNRPCSQATLAIHKSYDLISCKPFHSHVHLPGLHGYAGVQELLSGGKNQLVVVGLIGLMGLMGLSGKGGHAAWDRIVLY